MEKSSIFPKRSTLHFLKERGRVANLTGGRERCKRISFESAIKVVCNKFNLLEIVAGGFSRRRHDRMPGIFYIPFFPSLPDHWVTPPPHLGYH